MPDTSTLPRWDATALFPSLESRQLAAAHEAVAADVARLVALHDRHGVDETEPHEPSAEEIQAFEEVLAATNAVAADLLRLQVYVLSFVSTDSRNDAGQALFSELDRHDATMRQLVGPLHGVGGGPGTDGPGLGQPARCRPRLRPRSGRCPRRAPDGSRGGVDVRRAARDRLGCVGPAPQRRHVAAPRHDRPSRTARPSSSRSPRCAGWRPTPTPRCAGPPTTPSWRPGRRWRCPSPRR